MAMDTSFNLQHYLDEMRRETREGIQQVRDEMHHEFGIVRECMIVQGQQGEKIRALESDMRYAKGAFWTAFVAIVGVVWALLKDYGNRILSHVVA